MDPSGSLVPFVGLINRPVGSEFELANKLVVAWSFVLDTVDIAFGTCGFGC